MRRLAWVAVLACAGLAQGADVFVRFKVVEPAGAKLKATLGGWRHAGDPWYLPEKRVEATAGQWTPWQDLRDWPWHGRVNREGGVAEWPAMKIAVSTQGEPDPPAGSLFQVQLADAPDEKSVVISFTERSGSRTIGFLVPTPLREHAREFETGSQMTARHLAWAREATGGRPIRLRRMDICTSIWGHHDPSLARLDLQALSALGFNVVNAESGADMHDVKRLGFRMYRHTWMYGADPETMRSEWRDFDQRRLKQNLATAEGRWEFLEGVSHWVLSDEIRAVNVGGLTPKVRDPAFRAYLQSRGVKDEDLPRPIDQVEFPAAALAGKTLPRDADLPMRRLIYHAAKFQQWWSAKQLRLATDLVHASLPRSHTETLPTDHGFFNAWGPPCIGMSYPMLDLFELGAQHAVDQLSAEDWLGLNHMYGPGSTWTGGQTFGYFSAIMRCAIGDRPILLRSLITPSDDRFLRLKAYSALGQGSRSFFFWTYGPTYIGTENYWSDLRSQYDGIAKVNRALERAEDVLAEARVVRDPVAILYSVSHDYWHSDQPAAFVEKRLLWHALRHCGFQPDFLREEDVEAGRLKDYSVLYITDWCITRKASTAIDAWVRGGGVVQLSAGAATRDEFYEPYVPAFAQTVWPEKAAEKLVAQRHAYNERGDLPNIQPMGRVKVFDAPGQFVLPVIGCRLDLKAQGPSTIASFDDGAVAGAAAGHGSGRVVGLGFMPMLAYGQLAKFKPATLEEVWPAEPRKLVRLALKGVQPTISTSEDVVEASLLSGARGSVLVLANYTYQPIEQLRVEVRLDHPVAGVVSTEGKAVHAERFDGGIRLTLPLEWTEMVVLRRD